MTGSPPDPNKATGQPRIDLNLKARTVTVTIRKGLDLIPTTVDVPFVVWKETCAMILQHENRVEIRGPLFRG